MYPWYKAHPYGVMPRGNQISSTGTFGNAATTASKSIRFGQFIDVLMNDAAPAAPLRILPKKKHNGDSAQEETSHSQQRRQEQGGAAAGGGSNSKPSSSASGVMPQQSDLPLLMDAVLPFLDARDLSLASGVSTGWYVICHIPDLWKTLAITHLNGLSTKSLSSRPSERGLSSTATATSTTEQSKEAEEEATLNFHSDWKTTVVRMVLLEKKQKKERDGGPHSSPRSQRKRTRNDSKTEGNDNTSRCRVFQHKPIRMHKPVYNDVLFQGWLCTLLPPDHRLKPLTEKELLLKRRQEQLQRGAGGGGGTDDEGAASATTTAQSRAHPATSTCSGVGNKKWKEYHPSRFKTVDRLDVKNLPPAASAAAAAALGESDPSVAYFHQEYELPNLPCILQGVATEWPLFKKLNGDYQSMVTKKDEIFPSPQKQKQRKGGKDAPTSAADAPQRYRCESVLMTMDGYVQYSNEQQDERPLYLFDPNYAEAMSCSSVLSTSEGSAGANTTTTTTTNVATIPEGKMYAVPRHFGRDDFFGVMQKERPNYRWLIVGPKRGGSSFHVDPNFTNAWNAVMTGRKRWLMFPPHVTPPGVFPSYDMSYVATPASIAEWFLNYYDQAAATLAHQGYECICEPGEIMFVPCGWWHCVINLEDSVAITQNYVCRANLGKVFKFLSGMPKSISGLGEDASSASEEELLVLKKQFATRFKERMMEVHPEIASAALLEGVDAAEEPKKSVKAELHLEAGSEGFEFAW